MRMHGDAMFMIEGGDDSWLTCPLGLWMTKQRAVLAAMERGGSLDWGLAAADFTILGKTDHQGRAPTKVTCEETWRRIAASRIY
jgi:hypothetical protein